MKLTARMKAAGELAIRQMSDKARRVYDGFEPFDVYEYGGEDGPLYAIKVLGETIYGLTFDQVQAHLEELEA